MRAFILFMSLLPLLVNAAALKNTLLNNASPYLAMHGHDPVAWQQWQRGVIERARREGKLIYVSSGYFSCHWCHVMQRESYSDKKVAALLNKYFIPVKVDREINSALDSRLIDFVERTQGQAGWPLNVFITPEGYPLVGMTYLPRENFISVLVNIRDRWKSSRTELERIAKEAALELSGAQAQSSDEIPAQLADTYLKRFLAQAQSLYDDMSGGFGQQNKFPSVPQLMTLLHAYSLKKDKTLSDFLRLTLDKMATQGLNDHLGGGFFRYAVDPGWQIPHFEKMLYDNALMANLYMQAATIFNQPAYADIARTTLDFMLNELQVPQGAFMASLSAIDNKGVEGGYYLWNRDELENLLTQKELQITEVVWQLEGAPDLEHGHHLIEVMPVKEAAEFIKMPYQEALKLFASAKRKMLRARMQRRLPADNKLLAGWNGLALSAFSRAAIQFNNKKYAVAAKGIHDYLYKNLWDGSTLYRLNVADTKRVKGQLQDYAYVARGLYDWVQYKSDKQDRRWLREIIQQGWNRFYGRQGWLLAEDMLLKYGQGETVIMDGVMPSPSAILAAVTVKVAEEDGDKALLKQARKALNSGREVINANPFWYATQIDTILHLSQ